MEAFIRLENVSMLYGNNGTSAVALRDVSLSIEAGEYVVMDHDTYEQISLPEALLGDAVPCEEPQNGATCILTQKTAKLRLLSKAGNMREERIVILWLDEKPIPAMLYKVGQTGNWSAYHWGATTHRLDERQRQAL